MSDKIIIEMDFDRIRTALEKAADELFKSSYSNPVVDLLKECIKDQEGEIKKVIDEIIVSSISDPEFKTKMADLVIQRMVEGALKK